MIVTAQGTPGAGKTTVLQELAELSPTYTYVPEVVLPVPDSPTDDFFIENDVAKYRVAGGADIALIDRDFLSTIAFVEARDGQNSQSASRVSRLIDGHLGADRLMLPDLFLHFNLDFSTSVKRQNPLNPPFWSDKDFLGRFETQLSYAVGRYILANGVQYEIIDGTDDKHVIKRFILGAITELSS